MADKAVGLSNISGVKAWAADTFVRQGETAKVGTVTLSATWTGRDPFTQVVTIPGGTANSKIDLQLSAAVISRLVMDGVTALWIENDDGVFTACAMGGAAPTTALEVQYTRMEVAP